MSSHMPMYDEANKTCVKYKGVWDTKDFKKG
jgi:hypothetical protein